MGGLLTHIVTSVLLFFVGISLFRKNKWKYFFGGALAIGHLIPDLIDFGITGIIYGTLNPGEIMYIPLYEKLLWLGHTPLNWITFGVIVITILFALYKFKKISKKNFFKLIVLIICFLIGIGIHLIIDLTIIEKSYWI